MGCTVGRVANRIGLGQVRHPSLTCDLEVFHAATFLLRSPLSHVRALQVNNGPHHLHGGSCGFHAQHWAIVGCGSSVGPDASDGSSETCSWTEMRLTAREDGYPGECTATARYELRPLAGGCELRLLLSATVTQPCPVNLTQHSYFNLNGSANACDNHTLQVPLPTLLPIALLSRCARCQPTLLPCLTTRFSQLQHCSKLRVSRLHPHSLPFLLTPVIVQPFVFRHRLRPPPSPPHLRGCGCAAALTRTQRRLRHKFRAIGLSTPTISMLSAPRSCLHLAVTHEPQPYALHCAFHSRGTQHAFSSRRAVAGRRRHNSSSLHRCARAASLLRQLAQRLQFAAVQSWHTLQQLRWHCPGAPGLPQRSEHAVVLAVVRGHGIAGACLPLQSCPHVNHVTCHMSRVTCRFSLNFMPFLQPGSVYSRSMAWQVVRGRDAE